MLVELGIEGYVVDDITGMIAEMHGQTKTVLKIAKGYYMSCLNFDRVVEQFLVRHQYFDGGYDEIPEVPCYGVCDTPQQFIDRYGEALEAHEANYVVGFAHVRKNPEDAGKGGGWRWHKWGDYIGTREHRCEYLDDEDGFEAGVYLFKVVRVP
jgi:hypothetical protein